MQSDFDLGLDVGSVSVNLVVMTPQGEVMREVYRRHLGGALPRRPRDNGKPGTRVSAG
jgi:activator of 2-hydroxyglutaryl-CoA dehydratase